MTVVPRLSIRPGPASTGLLSLPWERPLAEWDATEVALRDVPVGPSRHLVRFVEIADRLYALKEMPPRVARQEYDVLRELQRRRLPAVAPVGMVEQPHGEAVLITEYLEGSWQYRRLFLRLPPDLVRHRERLLDAMAMLLVELHRNGIYWGDCSLANTLFKRDGQVLQAYLVDAETSRVHPILSDGQRAYDLDILVENVTGGLMDVAARLEQDVDFDEHHRAASTVAERYRGLWAELHCEPTIGFSDRLQVAAHIRRINDLGYAVDEVTLSPTQVGDQLSVSVAVAGRQFHAEQLREATGLAVGEGQATVLLNDLRSYAAELQRRQLRPLSLNEAGVRWLAEVYRPGLDQVRRLADAGADLTQAFCDLLEVRWLMSEEAGRDVGTSVALQALARRSTPPNSAAQLMVLEAATGSFPPIRLPRND